MRRGVLHLSSGFRALDSRGAMSSYRALWGQLVRVMCHAHDARDLAPVKSVRPGVSWLKQGISLAFSLIRHPRLRNWRRADPHVADRSGILVYGLGYSVFLPSHPVEIKNRTLEDDHDVAVVA